MERKFLSSMKKKYRAVIIGCGNIGLLWEFQKSIYKPLTHAGAFLKNKRINLVAVADTSEKNRKFAKKHLKKVVIYSDADRMLNEMHPDIVVIASSDETHHNMVVLCTKHKIRLILCEKPIATNINEAKDMIRRVKKTGSILLVNHMRRFDPVLKDVGKRIKRGEFGTIQHVRCLTVNGLMNNGTHIIDLLRWYFGDVVWVQGIKQENALATHKGDYNIDGILEFKNGVRATIQSIDAKQYYLYEHELYGTKKAVFIKNLGFDIFVIPKRSDTKGLDVVHTKRLGNPRRSYFKSMADHVVAVLDKKIKPASTGQDGLEALKILFAFRESVEKDGIKVFV
jgi:predicted dehydrogenase